MPMSQDVMNTNLLDVMFRKGFKMDKYAYNAGAATSTLSTSYPPVILCDPGGGAVDVLLPVEADSEGLVFFIFNTADAAEAISVKEDAGATVIITLAQNEGGIVYCDGTTWRGFVGGVT